MFSRILTIEPIHRLRRQPLMLLRFDPFRELDRLTDQLASQATTPHIPMDAVKRGDTVEIRFDLPGFDPGSVDLEVDRNVLTLTAERQWEPGEGDEVIANERRYGRFTRQLLLGDTLDGTDVRADFHDGVLQVTIPVAEAAKPRKVSIGGGSGSAAAIDVSERRDERELSSAN
jgi:HSP20 family protein